MISLSHKRNPVTIVLRNRIVIFLLVESPTSALLLFFIHVLNDIGKLSLHSFVFIALQEGKRSIEYSVCCFLHIGLAIHVSPNIALLAIAETTIARLNIIDNCIYTNERVQLLHRLTLIISAIFCVVFCVVIYVVIFPLSSLMGNNLGRKSIAKIFVAIYFAIKK